LSFSPTLRESAIFSYLSPDGRCLACDVGQERPRGGEWHYVSRELRVQDTATGKELLRLKNWLHSRRVAFTPDGRLLAHTGRNIALFNLRAGKPLPEITGPGGVDTPQILFAPDGKSVLSVHFDTGKLLLWDVVTRKKIRAIPWRSAKDFLPADGKIPLAFAP